MGDIVWLASYPKSGNTWARIFLHNLFLNGDEPADLNSLTKFTMGDGKKKWFERAAGRSIDNFSEAEITALIPKVHELYTRTRFDTVFVKTHNALRLINGIPLVTPKYTAGAIYFIRNPLDVVLSLANHFGQSVDESIDMMNNHNASTEGTDKKIPEFLCSWSDHVNSWLQEGNKSRVHVMRYEDMLYKPEKAFGGMAKFLGVKPSREHLRKAIKFSSFEKLRKLEDTKGFNERSDKAERFFRVGKAGQWKTALTPEQVEKIVAAHYDVMKKFKYLPPGYK